MDTEAIVKELMTAQKTKTTKLENKITKLEWKQEKWKDMNTKIYSFYTGSLSKARFQSNYQTKKATSSNESKLEVLASSSASHGTHSIKVKELASAQFVTGSKLSNVTGDTKLSDLGINATIGSTINVTAGEKSVSLDVGAYTTVNDFVDTLKSAGLNATYDTNQNRFFISSKETGLANTFNITMSSSVTGEKRNEIRDSLNYSAMATSDKNKVDNLLSSYKNDLYVQEDREAIAGELEKLQLQSVTKTLTDQYKNDEANIAAARAEAQTELEAMLTEGESVDQNKLKALTEEKLTNAANEYTNGLLMEYTDGTAGGDNEYQRKVDELNSLLAEYQVASATSTSVNSENGLGKLGLCNITDSMTAAEMEQVSYVAASDCTVIYNNAEIISSSNTISANGLTFTAKQVTAGANTEDVSDDEVINISVNNDIDGVYDMIKTFVKDYNELLKEMNTSYNADSSRGFEPLTDDEKEAMTDTEVEKWEKKIKDSLLRRDDQLSGVISALRTSMSGSVEVNGKSYSLSSFGIGTADYTEKGILHINGDSDDAKTASEEDKLRKAIEEDPDVVMQVMAKLASNLYSSVTDKMSTSSLSSALTVYNDKEMKKQITDYKSDLSTLEDKLKDIEDRYYKQFTAMEKAMSKLNAQTSSLASLMGTNTQ